MNTKNLTEVEKTILVGLIEAEKNKLEAEIEGINKSTITAEVDPTKWRYSLIFVLDNLKLKVQHIVAENIIDLDEFISKANSELIESSMTIIGQNY